MRLIADLHIHSKYSRAVSQEMILENIDLWARKKGIQVMGTGDFTHPQWFQEIKTKLEPTEKGLFKIKSQISNLKSEVSSFKFQDTRFLLTTEISSIYSKKGRVRRVHNLIFSPSIETVEKINTKLGWIGNLKSDGRPILGLDSKELLKIILDIDEKCVLVPAHAWTPWFSVFGSMSGFDSLEECFEELTPNIFAIETGLSSSPAMNWRLSKLDKISIISNSDSHSLQKIGREANIFDCELSYNGIIDAIKLRDSQKFLYTIEFFPEEGKYHYDGHRLCKISMSPEETKKNNEICPVCHKKVTIGVMNRVDKLADRVPGQGSENRVPFKSLIPLEEIIGDVLGVGVSSKAVKKEYEDLVKNIGTEFGVLLDADYSQLSVATSPEIASAIMSVRKGRVELIPGYDGEYGKIKILKEEKNETNQQKLF